MGESDGEISEQSVSILWANCSDEVHRTFSLLSGGKATWANGHAHDLTDAEDAPSVLREKGPC